MPLTLAISYAVAGLSGFGIVGSVTGCSGQSGAGTGGAGTGGARTTVPDKVVSDCGGAPPKQPPFVLPVETWPQVGNQLCWAACASMITSYLAPQRSSDLELCDFASVKSTEDCCAKPMPTKCDRAQFPPFVAKGFSVDIRSKGWPDWPGVLEELRGNRPLGLIENRKLGAPHMVVATGAHEVLGDRVLKVYDPAGDGSLWWHEYGHLTNSDTQSMGWAFINIRESSNPECKTVDGPDVCGEQANIGAAAPNGSGGCGPNPGSASAGSGAAGSGPVLGTGGPAGYAGVARVCLIGQADPASVGFQDAAEAKAGEFEIQLEPYYLQELDLKPIVGGCPTFEPSLKLIDTYVYVLGDRGRGFIDVIQDDDHWRPISYGNSSAAGAVYQIVRRLRQQDPHYPRKPRLLRVRLLNVYLVPYQNNYISSRAMPGIKQGEPYSMPKFQEAFKAALPPELNGLPF